MEKQINNQQGEKAISTTVGVAILVLVSIIIVLVIWKLRDDSDAVLDAPVIIPPVQVKRTAEPVAEVPEANNQAVVNDTPVDFDQEIKDLDMDINSVDSDDFGDAGLSNANLGL